MTILGGPIGGSVPTREEAKQIIEKSSRAVRSNAAAGEFKGPGGNPDGSGDGQAQQKSSKPATTAEKNPPRVSENTTPLDIKPIKSKPVFSAGKFGSLRYPKTEFDKDMDYLKIGVMRYKPLGFPDRKNLLREGLNSSKGSYKAEDPLGTILLPIPQNISDTNSTGWGQDSINAAGAYAMGIYDEVANTQQGFFKALGGAILGTGADIGKLAQDGSIRDGLNSFFASQAANLVPGTNTSFQGVLARTSGQILNPNTELLFNGIKLRSFNFTFVLAPRNEDEAEEIKTIIKTLKTNMAPTTASSGEKGGANRITGLFLKSPNVFKLEYMKGSESHPYLNKFIIAALTNMQVNYTASGTYATYDNGMPVHMAMTLAFQELSPVYAEDQNVAGGMGF